MVLPCPCPANSLWTNWLIFMKHGMNIEPLEIILSLYLATFCHQLYWHSAQESFWRVQGISSTYCRILKCYVVRNRSLKICRFCFGTVVYNWVRWCGPVSVLCSYSLIAFPYSLATFLAFSAFWPVHSRIIYYYHCCANSCCGKYMKLSVIFFGCSLNASVEGWVTVYFISVVWSSLCVGCR
jgi:hypothetical protein